MNPIDVLLQESEQLVTEANDSATDAEAAKKASDARNARQERIATLHENIRDSLKAMKAHHATIKSATEELKTLGNESDELENEGTERKRRVVGDATSLDLLLQSTATDGATDELDATTVMKLRSRSRDHGYLPGERPRAAASAGASDSADEVIDFSDSHALLKQRSHNGGHLPGGRR